MVLVILWHLWMTNKPLARMYHITVLCDKIKHLLVIFRLFNHREILVSWLLTFGRCGAPNFEKFRWQKVLRFKNPIKLILYQFFRKISFFLPFWQVVICLTFWIVKRRLSIPGAADLESPKYIAKLDLDVATSDPLN